jgi:uncharacterized protein (DUF433 family)
VVTTGSEPWKQVERLLGELSRGEEAQLLQWVARDLGDAHPGIQTEPSVCGGAATIVRTRDPRLAAGAGPPPRHERSGTAASVSVAARREDLANAWAYVRSHREEIDREIDENEAA